MIDPLVSLAFGVQAKKGAYALLLGSGVSRSAGIPTGWEVTLHLIGRVAELEGVNPPDPAAWYEERFKREPDYSELIDALGLTGPARRDLLKGYFEPTTEEREQGIKMPSAAHKAIARMVARGFIRYIITTNFDRLIEQALEDEGIRPRVVSSEDNLVEWPSIALEDALVFKLHGDYLDSRLLNTPAELARYEPLRARLLEQLLDQFGLVICGWSARYDDALVSTLVRSQNRRYPSYWAAVGGISPEAKRVIDARDAQVLEVTGADNFFGSLADMVSAIAESGRQHPLSARTASATLKRHMESGREMSAADLIGDETERVVSMITKDSLSTPVTKDEFIRRVDRYEAAAEVLGGLYVQGAYWSHTMPKITSTLIKSLERVINARESGSDTWTRLGQYSGLALLYAAGLAAVAASEYGVLNALLVEPRVRSYTGVQPFTIECPTWRVMDESNAQWFFEPQKMRTPLSDHMFTALRPSLAGILPNETDYAEAFDQFEVLFALAYADIASRDESSSHTWVPVGRFLWRRGFFQQMTEDFSRQLAAWPPLRGGFLGGDLDRCTSAWEVVRQFVSRRSW